MKPVNQTKLHTETQNGNCMAAVVASFLECSIDEVPELFPTKDSILVSNNQWILTLTDWLEQRGWEWGSLDGHTDGYYLVVGKTRRCDDFLHVCIYKDGVLFHDPHPDKTGLITEEFFEYLIEK